MNIVRILIADDYELARRKFYGATAENAYRMGNRRGGQLTASMLSRSVSHGLVELLAHGYDTIMTGQLPVLQSLAC
jgi:hypothetical protein